MGAIVDIWLIIIVLMVAAGIAFRIYTKTLPAFQMHKVAPGAASRLVADFIASCAETDFGYPSGYFQIEQVTPTEVSAKEWVAKGSHFTQILKGFYRAILALGSPFGCLGMFIMLYIAAIATPFLVYAALTETLLKYLLRSRVRATLTPVRDGTEVTFTLRGPDALLVGRRLEHAFNAPVLPPRVAALAGVTAPQPRSGSGPAPVGAAA